MDTDDPAPVSCTLGVGGPTLRDHLFFLAVEACSQAKLRAPGFWTFAFFFFFGIRRSTLGEFCPVLTHSFLLYSLRSPKTTGYETFGSGRACLSLAATGTINPCSMWLSKALDAIVVTWPVCSTRLAFFLLLV